jgi:hypothetical protein|tara:strand:- start:667 stop:936 length:270 start_codon:yes stop_codon:yes gene_type:complete
MYIIVNETKGTVHKFEGMFPNLDEVYKNGDKFYLISLYSMTVKIPKCEEGSGKRIYQKEQYNLGWDVEYEEFPLPKELIKAEYLVNMGK